VNIRANKIKIVVCAILLAGWAFVGAIGVGALLFSQILPLDAQHRELARDRLYRAVQGHVREHGESEVALGELVDFEWDKALIFSGYFTNRATIDEAINSILGVNFPGRIDRMRGGRMIGGVIFVRDDAIVYYETHTYVRRGMMNWSAPRLSISMTYGSGVVRIFGREDMFRVSAGNHCRHAIINIQPGQDGRFLASD